MSATREARNRAAAEQARLLAAYVASVTDAHARLEQAVGAAADEVRDVVEHRASVVGVHAPMVGPVLAAHDRVVAARMATATQMVRLVADTEEHAATVTAAAIARHSTATGSVDARLLEGFRADSEVLEHAVIGAIAAHDERADDYARRVQVLLDEWVAFEEAGREQIAEEAKVFAAARLHHAHIGSVQLLRAAATGQALPSPVESPPPLAPPSPFETALPAPIADDSPDDTPLSMDAPPVSPVRRRGPWRLLARTALPVIGVTAVLAVLLALIG